jgi:hypothetical protein
MDRSLVSSLLLAAGIATGGFLVGQGFARGRAAEHFVTVKGISERNVTADLAIWPLRISAASNDLGAANAQIQQSIQQIRQFLTRYKIDPSQASLQDFSVTDAATNQFSTQRAESRYVIHQTVVVRSEQPERVLDASQHVAELVNAGVVLSSGGEYGSGGPTFIFSGLSRLGGIKEANQGVFEILPRDQARGITEASQIQKTVRVVSTVQYFLRQ